MKVQIVEYDDDGKIQKKWWADVTFASSNSPPVVCINWDKAGTKRRHIEMIISAKRILSLILGGVIENFTPKKTEKGRKQ